MSDINTYANQAAIDNLVARPGDLVLNRETNALHLCTAINPDVWKIFTNDFVASGVPQFPFIHIFEQESEFIDETAYPDYTLAYAKDTNKLYVREGSIWLIYYNDPQPTP